MFHFIKLIKKQGCIYFHVQPTFLKRVFWECCSQSLWSTWRWRITVGRISALTSAAPSSCHQTLAKDGKENHILSKKPPGSAIHPPPTRPWRLCRCLTLEKKLSAPMNYWDLSCVQVNSYLSNLPISIHKVSLENFK